MTFEDYQVMSVSLMVSEEKVLAVCGIDFLPVFEGQFYGRKRRMGVVNEFYAVVFKESVNLCYSFIHVRD